MLTNDGRCTGEIACKIAMAKAAFSKKRALYWHIELGTEQETTEVLHFEYSFIWR